MTLEDVFMCFEDAPVLKVDGHDSAIIGIAYRCGQSTVLAYDTYRIIHNLMEKDGMTEEEAWEHYEFNIAGAYHGEGTPVFVELIAEVKT